MVDEILFIMRLLKTMLNMERAKQKSREILNKIIFSFVKCYRLKIAITSYSHILLSELQLMIIQVLCVI